MTPAGNRESSVIPEMLEVRGKAIGCCFSGVDWSAALIPFRLGSGAKVPSPVHCERLRLHLGHGKSQFVLTLNQQPGHPGCNTVYALNGPDISLLSYEILPLFVSVLEKKPL